MKIYSGNLFLKIHNLCGRRCTAAALHREGPASRLRGPISQNQGIEVTETDPDLRTPTATTITDSRTRTPAPLRTGTHPPG